MGYYEVLELLYKQLENITTEEEYLKQQRKKALQTKDIALELNINIRSVSNAIAKMLKEGEIKCLTGEKDITEKHYIIKIEKVVTHANTNNHNAMGNTRRDKPNPTVLDNKKTP